MRPVTMETPAHARAVCTRPFLLLILKGLETRLVLRTLIFFILNDSHFQYNRIEMLYKCLEVMVEVFQKWVNNLHFQCTIAIIINIQWHNHRVLQMDNDWLIRLACTRWRQLVERAELLYYTCSSFTSPSLEIMSWTNCWMSGESCMKRQSIKKISTQIRWL